MSTRENTGIVIIGVACVLLCAVLVAATLSQLERVEEVVVTPPRGEARANSLLAAERLLSGMGMTADSAASLDELPPVDHALIVGVENRPLTQVRADRLLEWVERGGLLIIGPHLENGEPVEETWSDPLLRGLGVEVFQYADDPGGREDLEIAPFDEQGTESVSFFSGFGLMITDEEKVDIDETYASIWSNHGLGRAVVLNDVHFMRNDEIGKLDHASFLWRLARDGGARQAALLVHGWSSSSLWVLLWQRAWPATVVGGLLLAAWLGRHAARLGPVIPEPAAANRSLMEHVDALGHFLWRCGRRDTLIDAARSSLKRQIASRRPHLASLDRERQVSALASACEIPADRIDAAVFGEIPRTRERFTRTLRTLETLRRQL